MNKEYVMKILSLIQRAPEAELDYNELRSIKYQGLPRDAKIQPDYIGLKGKISGVFNIEIPTLLCVEECAKALGYSIDTIMEFVNYNKGLVLGKDGVLRRYPLHTLLRSEQKGKTIYLGSSALKVFMDKKGLDTTGLFVDIIPVFQQCVEQKGNCDYLQNELNYSTYRVILRNGRRKFFLSKNPPRIVIYNEAKLVEKAVREFYALLEEKGII